MLLKIPVDDVRPGMFIQKLEGSWFAHPFWRGSFLLEAASDLVKIRNSGVAEVWIDTDKGLGLAAAAEGRVSITGLVREETSTLPLSERTPPTRVRLAEEIGQARRLYERSKPLVRAMFGEARLGRAIDTESAKTLVQDISDSLARNSWALVSVARIKTADEYTYMHSVAVCALMVVLARQLGLPEDETRQAGLAGLLHDIGKAGMPMTILNKPDKLTEPEFAVIKTHPREGWEMLRKVGDVGEIALDVCLHHHEKLDGTGYPDRLAGEAISLHARMGAVCDIYDAVTSNRPYKKGWDPAESLRNMSKWTKSHLDERAFAAFVKSLGIYPIGSLVRLESGLLGVVVEQAEGSLLTPRVRAFYSAKSLAYVKPRLVDLACASTHDRIVGLENAADWCIADVGEYWQ
ncbi:cyclic di-GMP phosphodiesterase response regulator RpfG [mine drainage metagenome]|uniref:Cyclic di-GMP phosphodiesterase response regulator RpfG n=1 Tax=mine drainage metagenome TaxID=410659 RepID=A0A1J5QFB1_9ZZZZ